ncbi:hypothetical protein [Paraburkholderia sp. HD33-4]|uniref:hypothetical protein n=1 Tax=Paraburkholderia sp. HD33-4 TaxID=2883242 RepID=UPI001F34A098|nr:hypothetical protein [Paraburkholderia sp. HD33-4]
MPTPTDALNLRLIAAMAEKIAKAIERGALWPGELTMAVAQMQKWLNEIKER